ncbi:hypothetical protein Esti_003273 [Eimeria stiedai]
MGKLALRTIWAAAALAASSFEESAALKSGNGQDGVLAASTLEREENDQLPKQFLESSNSHHRCVAQGMTASLGSERLIALTSVETAGRCQQFCTDIADCLAAVFQADTSTCYLLKTIQKLQSEKNSALLLPTCDDWCFKTKKTIVGEGTKIGEVSNANFCQALCASNEDCAAFSWNMETDDCLSFSSNSGYKMNSKFISGDRESCSERTRQKSYAGICSNDDVASNTKKNVEVAQNVTSFEDCQSLCLSTSGCNWANFAANEERCYMKEKVGDLVRLHSVTSGPKFCDSSCFWKNVGISNAHLRIPGTSDAHRCHYECAQNSSCKFWTYSENTEDCLLSSNAEPTGVYDAGSWSGIKDGCGSEAYSARTVPCAVPGVKYTGEALETAKLKDALECQDYCKGNDYCKAFTFDLETKECLLFRPSAVNSREESVNHISGASVCDKPCFQFNVQHVGTEVGRFPNGAQNADECKIRCQASGECTHFSFSSYGHECILFKSKGTRKSEGFISGPKSCNVHEEGPNTEDNCDVDGYEAPRVIWSRELRNKSLEDCRNACTKDGQCHNFSYYGAQRICVLADAFSLRAQRPNMAATLGFKSCSKCIRPNVGYKSTSPEFLYGSIAQNAEECRRRCDLQQRCYRFSYNKADKTCSMFSGSPTQVERGSNFYSGPYRCSIERGCLQYGRHIKKGNLLATTAISDEGQCHEWCGAHADCTWFSWAAGECKLYNGQVETEGRKGSVIGPKKCMPDVKDSELCDEQGLSFRQGTLREVGGIRFYPLCAAECRREPRCRLWTLNVQWFHAKCFLLTIESFSQVGHHEFKRSAPRLGCPRCIRKGMEIVGNVLKVQEVRNVTHCQLACEFEPKCKNFTYTGKTCTLRSSFEKAISASDYTISGPKEC